MNDTYVNIYINAVSGNDVTIEYEVQNNGSHTFRALPTTGCYSYTTQALCENAQQNGEACMWNWGNTMCEEDTNTQQGIIGGGGLRKVECFEFDNNDNCQNITVCKWTSADRLCDPDPINWSYNVDVGVACTNISDENFCNSVPVLNTLCSWNSTDNCYANSTKSKANMGGLDMSCEGIGTNDTMCNESINTYFKPCEWDGTICTFNHQGVFGGGGPGLFGDINTQESCESMGGAWMTETFKYTDSYNNQKTDTDSWCEMTFGGFSTGMTGCDEMCWACEDSAATECVAGDVTCARSACQNSSLGFCQFHEDSNAFNGIGWCDMKMQMMMGGMGMSCDNDCAACDFLENASGKCNSSTKGCKFITDPRGGAGWCEDSSAKICQTDCFSCFDSTSCTTDGKGTAGACEWDDNNYYCKPAGFDGEICFDGIDNDNDDKIDCGDPDCGFDHFCGGKFLDTNNCGQYTTTGDCTTASCLWIIDDFDVMHGSAGHCGNQGEQCWMFDENSTGCDLSEGCGWKTGGAGMCDVNSTLSSNCSSIGSDSELCNTTSDFCIWQRDEYGGSGHCDFKMFKCHDFFGDPAGCNADGNCTWMTDMFSSAGGSGGHCEPTCFSLSPTDCDTNADTLGLCQTQSGFCEPDSFGGNCPNADGNQTQCANNTGCTWMPDPYYDNSSGSAADLGWCNSFFDMQMFQGMEGGPPVELGQDNQYPSSGEPEDPYLDIKFFGIKDNSNTFGFGIGVRTIDNAAVCNGMILSDFSSTGAGRNTTKFYWYLDTDGNTTNGCASEDGGQTGFEFKFKYIGEYSNNTVLESRVAYQCSNASFGPVAIPLSSWKQQMCQMLQGGMVSVDKEAMKRFKSLYNDTQNMRIYAVVAGNLTNESNPSDTVGPGYYTPGAFDFKMEDCFAPGQDLDGDGFDSDNDPDCQDFKKYGFIPMEQGPGCSDGLDNDNDGKTDCDDDTCKYDPFFCGGSLAAISTDKTAPSIILHKKNIFPDAIKISITEDKPTNASLEFYGQTGVCGAASSINTTLGDANYDTYHGFMLDNTSLGFDLTPNKTYAYKMTIYDPSGNLAKSGCVNFTTKASADENDCPKCNFTIAPKYDTPTDGNESNATGNMYFSVDLNSDGVWDIENDTMEYGNKINYKEGKNSTIRFTNLNSTEKWAIQIEDIDIVEAITSQTTSSTERSKPIGNMSDEFKFNTTNASDKNKLIGLGSDKFKRMMQNMGAEKLKLTVPMTGNRLWHCNENNLTNCVDVSSESGVSRTASDSDSTTWEVPISFGMGFSVYTTSTVASDSTTSSGGGGGSSSSSGGGGGIASQPEEDETKTFIYSEIKTGVTKGINVGGSIIPITKVEFKTLNDLKAVTFAVKSFRQQPKKVEDDIDGAEVYKFMAFEYLNIKSEDVEDIVIRFKVKKSWLDENNAEPDEVKLRRYKTTWTTLPTTKTGEDSVNVFYKATSPGLSYFAITVPEKEVEEVEEIVEEEPEVIAAPEEESEPDEGSPYTWLWWTIGIIVILIVIFIIVKGIEPKASKKRKRKKKK